MADSTQERIFWLLDRRGPMTSKEIARRLGKRRMAIYKALQSLREANKVLREGEIAWHRVYRLRPGATPPDDGRGLHPNSRAALYQGRRRAASDMWRPCALADLLRFPLGNSGGQD